MDDPYVRDTFSVLLDKNQDGWHYGFAEGVNNTL